jgi:alpha-tubulin suppressor-like RCC1 family protein
VVDLGEPAEQVTAGQYHTCALLRRGAVRCWGFNGMGALGYEDPQNVGDQPGEMPPPDVAIGGRVVQIAAGWLHTCALLETKRVRCWGDWQRAQLGHGLSQLRRDRMPPEDVPLGGDVERLVSVGGEFSCAQLADGSLRCWGRL